MTPLEALQHDWILEGLPPKVLLHHQRMFGSKDEKLSIKDATTRSIQGFPQQQNTLAMFQKKSQQETEEFTAAQKRKINKFIIETEKEYAEKQLQH